MNATNPYFANTASELAHSQVTCDRLIFIHGGFPNQQGDAYNNLAILADLAKFSSGSLYYFPQVKCEGSRDVVLERPVSLLNQELPGLEGLDWPGR